MTRGIASETSGTAAPAAPDLTGRPTTFPGGIADVPLVGVGSAVQDRARRLGARLFAPVDIAPLVIFRVMFGLLMLWEVWRYFEYGWIGRYYIEPTFHFTYFGFEWLRPWPGGWMYQHFAALAVLAGCIALGLSYRISAILWFLGFTYVFLLDQARYLNHFYLISLVSFLMIFVPANRSLSVDAMLRPNIATDQVPTWTLWMLRLQIGIVYFYAGLAKLNPDWLRGQPMRMWLAEGTDFPVIGPLFTQDWMVYAFSYGGLLFDLLAAPFLLWRRTRLIALAAVVGFHLANWQLFSIGVFPWFMLAATILFLPPSWSRRFLGLFTNRRPAAPDADDRASNERRSSSPRWQRLTLGLLAAWFAVQLLFPFRHLLYPGDVAWTEEGHRFSWRMKLRDKWAQATFFATDPATGSTWQVDPFEYVNQLQYSEMAARPDMLLQLAHHMAADLRGQGYERIEIRAEVLASLNGREPQLLLDPKADLAAQPRDIWPATWILPLQESEPGGGLGGEPETE